jgi:NAD dependent epimerase/dehydratase
VTQTALLTGAGGFIGSHLAEALVRAGYRLRAFVHYNSRGEPGFLRDLPPEIQSEIELAPGDITDPGAVQAAVHGCETVFHLAALISIPYSYYHPRSVVAANLTGTLNVLEACLKEGVRRLLHTSTSEVYGTARTVPISEDHPLQGQSPYAASKIGADKLAESYFCSFGLPVVTVRPFNTYGPRQSARAVIPALIAQALTLPVVRIGSNTRRDFTYVTDTAAGFVHAAAAPDVEGQVFNLGTGQEVWIHDLANTILALSREFRAPGTPAPVLETDEARLRPEKSEVQRLISDNSKARQSLGWQPAVDLTQGLHRTTAWIAAHPELFRPNEYAF